MLAALFQLERSQWLPPQELWKHTRRQLAALLRHAASTCPYYASRAADFLAAAPEEFTPDQFATLPLLRRREVQVHFGDMASRSVPPQHGKVQSSSTSGSTGEPVRYLSTDLVGFYWQAFNLRDHLWHRRDFSLKLAIIRSETKSEMLGNWFGDVGATTLATGPCLMIPMNASIESQADQVLESDPAYLTGHATNLVALLRTIAARERSLPGLRQVRCMGEAVPDESREYVSRAWGVPLIDLYSTRETGYIALQCPDGAGYHVQSESAHVEIIGPDGAACRPGETGQVVVTPLHNFAFPLIRYAVGDYAQVGEACGCGRGLPVIRRILGRSRNLMRLPDGSTRWPVFGIPKFLSIAPIRQFQFVQRSLDDLEVRLAVERALTPQEQARFGEHIAENLGHRFRLRWVFVPEIPASKSGKFEDFICDFE